MCNGPPLTDLANFLELWWVIFQTHICFFYFKVKCLLSDIQTFSVVYYNPLFRWQFILWTDGLTLAKFKLGTQANNFAIIVMLKKIWNISNVHKETVPADNKLSTVTISMNKIILAVTKFGETIPPSFIYSFINTLDQTNLVIPIW